MIEMLEGLGEKLAKAGIGGFYRRTVTNENVKLIGPYNKRKQANPYGEARLPINISSEYHLRKPPGVIPPNPVELEEFVKIK